MKLRILALSLLFNVFVFAQDQAPTGGRPSGGRTETPTRGVVKYKAMERALLQAQQDKQQEAVGKLLAEDFEVWSAEANEPTPREIFEQKATGANISWFQIRNMAVRDFGSVAIVSFLLDRRGEMNGKAVTPTVFVVDVWQQQTGKLAVRYISAPGKAAAQLMPTGKE
jgi:hypothetical protein